MIEVMNVSKKFPKVQAVDNVSMVVKPGKITILLGENGAGKSTTIKSIVGLLDYQGKIQICGKDNLSIDAKRVLGYVPETPVLFDNLTIQEHVVFIGSSYQVPEYQENAKEYLKEFKLEEKKKTMIAELSKGMRQKVSMILALIINPKVLVVDEPMVGLDPGSIEKTLAIIERLKQQGVCVFISTHIIDMMEDIWEEAYIMHKGALVCHLHKEEMKNQSLKEIFFEKIGVQL